MRARALVLGSALAVCFCLLCAGQIGFERQSGPNQPNQVRTLSGTVVNSVTGEPIPRALVRILTNPPAAAMTGPDGHFDIRNVPANQTVGVFTERPGYGSGNGLQQSQMASPGENNITIKLVPQGGIQGHVADDEGQPIEGIQVQAISEQIVAGRKQERPVSTTSTGGDGEYEIDGLAPGAYFVKTMLHPLYWIPVPLPAAEQAYPGEFYPDAPDQSGAQTLPVLPGQTAEADFTLKPVRTFRITGTLAGVGSGQPASVTLKRPDRVRLSIPIRVNWRTGQFSLLSVPAGSYTLEFRTYPRPHMDSFYAEQQMDVHANVTGLQIAGQPLAPSPVNVVRPPTSDAGNGSPRVRSSVQIQLIAHNNDPGNNGYWGINSQQQPSTPGTLEIRGVPPGSYHVAVHTYGSECLDTISSGSTDLTSQDLTVSAGAAPQPITVTLRNDCATLGGTVNAQGHTAPVQVLVVPDSGAAEPHVINTAPGSQFSVTGLRPGDYRIYAFSTLDGLEYTNPDALRDFDAQEITLSANEKAGVTLDLIVRGNQ
ncbi:MAG: carboxypeptidase regulatory-like domain-containing protein [Bryobacteraceae bacterium]